MMWRAKISDYRDMMEHGLAGVRDMLESGKCAPEEADVAFQEYRVIFGIIDALTPDERENPLETIDRRALGRIADTVGVADREVIQFLTSLQQYNEMVCRAELGIFE